MFKRLSEEYEYLWNWLLNKGTVVALIIVNAFLLFFVIVAMLLVKLFSGKH
jgi:hypothetical protein